MYNISSYVLTLQKLETVSWAPPSRCQTGSMPYSLHPKKGNRRAKGGKEKAEEAGR